MLATFDAPARAIRCARAVMDAILPMGLQMRAGLHTAEVESRGEDIAGITVNIAARIQALAEPGEVLVSRTVLDLIAGSGLTFDERGGHDLKGIPGARQLYALADGAAQS